MPSAAPGLASLGSLGVSTCSLAGSLLGAQNSAPTARGGGAPLNARGLHNRLVADDRFSGNQIFSEVQWCLTTFEFAGGYLDPTRLIFLGGMARMSICCCLRTTRRQADFRGNRNSARWRKEPPSRGRPKANCADVWRTASPLTARLSRLGIQCFFKGGQLQERG